MKKTKIVCTVMAMLIALVLTGYPQTASSDETITGSTGTGSSTGTAVTVNNGDFSEGAEWSTEGWDAAITWGVQSSSWIDYWSTFSISGNQFIAGTASTATADITPASISQEITFAEAGTYTASLWVTSQWSTASGDTVSVEVLNSNGAVIGTAGSFDLSDYVSDWQKVEATGITVSAGEVATLKITFDINTASAGCTIDDVTVTKI
ncbi:MAG: hypothetical protein R3Y36_05410 [Spirochaetales bacterium]